jgi:hypothetical protein
MHCEGSFRTTQRVVFQAKLLMAATKEVRSHVVHASVGDGARLAVPIVSDEITARAPFWVFLYRNAISERFPSQKKSPPNDQKSMRAARDDPARRCREGTRRRRQDEGAGRLTCRPPAHR